MLFRSGIYNLGSAKDYSIFEIFQMIENEIQSGLEPIFKPELPGEAFRTLADISETQRVGWEPRISIQEGIQSFVEYTRERLSRELKAN